MSVEVRSYDERWGPVARRMRRAGRYCRYIAKSSLGLSPRILLELKWRLGDEIMAIPIFEAIKNRYPTSDLAVLCTYPELLEGNPFVDTVNPTEPDPDRYYLLRGVARDVYRLAHYARQADVVAPVTRPTLYFGEWESAHVGELPPGRGPLVALATGASWETKRWPAGRWQALGAALEARGCRVMAMGSAGESPAIGVDFCGRTSVREAAVLLNLADVLVCNDSGLMHLALAVDTPTVALFGPTDPAILIRDEPLFHSIDNARGCVGCWNGAMTMLTPGVCPLDIASCMDPIGVEDVLARVDTALAGRALAGRG